MYVDYSYYTDQYGGTVPSADFVKLERKASGLVDYYTFNRIDEPSEAVKACVCEMIDEISNYETQLKEGTGLIKSETVSKHSVSYAMPDEGAKVKSIDSRLHDIVRCYLLHTGLMYRGVK